MKSINFLLLFILLPITGFSQIQGEDEVYLGGDRIEAKFNGGGIDKFSEFINREFDYSKVLKDGKLEATFTVDEQGNVTKIRITQMIDIESATEFIRVLKKSPKWQPASRGGKPISIEIKYPMVFRTKAKQEQDGNQSTSNNPSENNSESKVYQTTSIESKPDFTGGLKKFYEYIGKNFKVPDVQGLSGKILASFIVETDGSLTSIVVSKDIGYGTKDETIRVLKNCPKWIPGMQNGVPVRCIYNLPITIKTK